MTTHPIPGQLFLLLTNDAGRQDSTSYRRQALAAAAITELMLYERLTLTEERSPKITVRDRTPLDLPVLDQALGALEELQGKALEVQHPAARAVKKLMDDMTAVMITTSVAT